MAEIRNPEEFERPILSIVIVSYLSRSELPDCLSSIPVFLKGRRVETIVVDNSLNMDGTEEIVLHAEETIYIQPGKNLGFGKANNMGFRKSTGEFILFLNPDTILRKSALEHCLNRLIDDIKIGLISPKLVTADGSMDLACRRSIPTIWDGFCRASGLARIFPRKKLFTGYNLLFLDENLSYPVGAINGAFMMTRRNYILKVGLFDEDFFMYGDDLDLCYRFSLQGYNVVYDGREWITHLKGVSMEKDHRKMQKAIFDGNMAFYLKHFNPGNSKFVAFKYRFFFGLWKYASILISTLIGRRKAKPV